MPSKGTWGSTWFAKAVSALALLFLTMTAWGQEYELQVSVSSTINTPDGMVVGDFGVHCNASNGRSCKTKLFKGMLVTVEAIPEPGYRFSHWEGSACIGEDSECTLTMNGDQHVSAKFVQGTSPAASSSHWLSVSPWGGDGVVSFAGKNCRSIMSGVDCRLEVPDGQVISLDAIPDPSNIFVGWQGDCSGATPRCYVRVDRVKYVNALFTPQSAPIVPLEVDSVGGGSVTVDPIDMDCKPTVHNSCKSSFPARYSLGTPVVVTARAQKGYEFTGWGGACLGQGNPCTVTMDSVKKVHATYRPLQKIGIQVNTLGAQSSADEVEVIAVNGQLCHGGILGGISAGSAPCNPTVFDAYDEGDSVTLKAQGSNFKGWGGDCSGRLPYCTVVMYEDKVIDAHFNSSAPPPSKPGTAILHITAGGRDNVAGNKNTVTVLPSGITCVFECEIEVPSGTHVVLKANPAPDEAAYYFDRWKIDANGGNPCVYPNVSQGNDTCIVQMDADKTVVASFYQGRLFWVW